LRPPSSVTGRVASEPGRKESQQFQDVVPDIFGLEASELASLGAKRFHGKPPLIGLGVPRRSGGGRLQAFAIVRFLFGRALSITVAGRFVLAAILPTGLARRGLRLDSPRARRNHRTPAAWGGQAVIRVAGCAGARGVGGFAGARSGPQRHRTQRRRSSPKPQRQLRARTSGRSCAPPPRPPRAPCRSCNAPAVTLIAEFGKPASLSI
jgi:hypothetical protein